MYRRIVVLTALFLALGRPSLAQSVICGTDADTVYSATLAPGQYLPFRPGVPGEDLKWRDIEVMWDAIYTTTLSDSAKETIASFAASLVDSSGTNPFGVGISDMNLIYEYFRREGITYTTDAADTAAIRFGNVFSGPGGSITQYKPSDRSHADIYIINNAPEGGRYPSRVATDDEDVTSFRAIGDVRSANALSLKGPAANQWYDPNGAGWTAPDAVAISTFNHEFQHGLPPTLGTPFPTEMMSAGAEAIGGTRTSSTHTLDVAYTWSLLGEANQSVAPSVSAPCTTSKPTEFCVRAVGSNYQGRTMFGAYVAYNFRGADTSATLSGMSDDLLWRWVRTATRDLIGLRNLLSGSDCGTCSTKTYFHPGGSSMDLSSRLTLLHHNWRVANYVNNPQLDEGQYGYAAQFGFSPASKVGAWQRNDPYTSDDVVAIPPEVSLTTVHRTQELTLKGQRSLSGTSYPLTLQPYGSEYWVIRADPAVWASGQELVVRVSAEDIHKITRWFGCTSPILPRTRDARLVASVVTYAPPSDSVAQGRLWAHPEWVVRAHTPQWADADSLIGDLEFTISSFGDSVKAAIVVLSLADGPSQYYATFTTTTGFEFSEALHYRLDVGLRVGGGTASPTLLSTASDEPTWSPTGLVLAYSADSSSSRVIRRRPSAGGSATHLAFGYGPHWSPRGDRIAFGQDSTTGQGRVWICDTLGGQATKLTVRSGMAVSPVFSPNGQQIAYARSVNDCETEGYTQQEISALVCPGCGWEVRRVNVDGTNDTLLTRLCPYEQEPVRSIRWSPDGRWLYLKKQSILSGSGLPGPDRLLVVSASGGSPITRSGLADDATSFDLHQGSGRILIGQVGTVDEVSWCTESTPDSNIRDTTITHQVYQRVAMRDTTSGDVMARFYRPGAVFSNPRWSPNGTQIAYNSTQNTANTTTIPDIYVGQVTNNRAPMFTSLPDTFTVYGGTSFELTLNGTDADGEALTYEMPTAFMPAGSSFSPATRTFTWSAPWPAGAQYYVVARVKDGSGGVASRVIKLTVTIGNLAADIVGGNEVWLMWSSPGDDGSIGQATEYDLRYWTSAITPANFYSGTEDTSAPSPDDPEDTEYHGVMGLSQSTGYWFAVRARYPSGAWSPVSNVVYVETTSGGGGGMRAQEASATRTGRLSGPMSAESGGVGGEEYGGVAVEMSLQNGAPYWRTHALDASQAEALGGDSIGVLFQVKDQTGEWVTRAQVRSSEATWRYAVLPKRNPSRTVFLGGYGVQQAWSEVRIGPPGALSALRIEDAQHSRRGDVSDDVNGVGNDSLEVSLGDTLSLACEWTNSNESAPSSWLMIVGPPGSEVEATGASLREPVGESVALPVAFALRQNHPNPFNGQTFIRFELPTEAQVRLELFDAQGRRIRTLANGSYPAGFHSAEWNRRDDRGRLLGPGVYLYRIQAGPFRAQKKMVLLP